MKPLLFNYIKGIDNSENLDTKIVQLFTREFRSNNIKFPSFIKLMNFKVDKNHIENKYRLSLLIKIDKNLLTITQNVNTEDLYDYFSSDIGSPSYNKWIKKTLLNFIVYNSDNISFQLKNK